MNMKAILSLLQTDQQFIQRTDGCWLEDPDLDVERMTVCMVEMGARLVTISAMPAADGETRLVYHWDIEGNLINLGTLTREGVIPSIAPNCPAADWIEREVKDYFAVDFSGRENLAPLVLRKGDHPGLFHWNGQLLEEKP
jgi:NADH:ubiquinone oxidoreductase subunit C